MPRESISIYQNPWIIKVLVSGLLGMKVLNNLKIIHGVPLMGFRTI